MTYAVLPLGSPCVWQRATYASALALWAAYNAHGIPARLIAFEDDAPFPATRGRA